jgi:hypothetical protein
MNIKSYLLAAALALSPLLSQASVIYEWEAQNNQAPRGVVFRLEFDEATLKSGSFDFEASNMGSPSSWLPQNIGLISFSFSFPGGGGVGYFKDEGYGNVGVYPSYLSMHVGFGDYLSGSIIASGLDTAFKMVTLGNDNVFTIFDLQSDAEVESAGCPPPWVSNVCAGAQGTIQRVNEVPEPGSFSLVGAGLFAASRFRRKKA